MARDPFAPVPQSSVPPWVWIVVGTVVLMLVGVGSTLAVVMSRRSAAIVATKQPTVQPAPEVTTPIAGPATDKPGQNQPAAAADTAAKPDKGDSEGDGDKAEKKKKKSSKSKTEKPAAKPDKTEKADKTAPPAKKKPDISQKDIDKLLGL